MVVHDEEFSVDLTKLTDIELQARRLKFVKNLFNGDKGSRDNVEKESLINEIDLERERRYKLSTEKNSWWALIISIISILVAVGTFLMSYYKI